MPKLTALEVRNAKGPCRLPDGEGLSFEITTTGVKRWLYRYRLDGKQQMLILGRYPGLSLEKARKAHREANELRMYNKKHNPGRKPGLCFLFFSVAAHQNPVISELRSTALLPYLAAAPMVK